MEKENNTKNIKKTLLISIIVMLLIVVYVLLKRVFGIGTEMLFLGIIVWAKCFHLSLKPLDILKCWTGAAVGVGIWLCEYFFGHHVSAVAGLAVLIILIFVQLVFDIGHINSWIVNPATPFFLTLTIAMANYSPMEQIVKDFLFGFLLAGIPYIIIGAVLSSRKKEL